MYKEAESLGGSTYCESCFACLTAYLSYLCVDTHYEKVLLIVVISVIFIQTHRFILIGKNVKKKQKK